MTLLAGIADKSILAFGLILLVVQLLAHAAGYWLGRRRRGSAAGSENVNVVVGAMLGLLAFVLALTLSFANARFAERRAGTLAEANAIGTAWLRAEAIDHPRGKEIARLLEEYTQVRRDYVVGGRDRDQLSELNQNTSNLQSSMWGNMTVIVHDQRDPVSTSLMSALNEVFDEGSVERFAFDLRLPPEVFWLLIGMTVLSVAALGYQFGLKGNPSGVLLLLLTVMWTAVIVDILDLASPRLGRFRTDTAAYGWTLQSFKTGVAVPPMPK